jgi:transposase
MAPRFVKPYVKTNKNDRNDAEAICEAVARPNMRFVPIKSAEQQALLALHCARSGWVKARTAQANQIRGLLSEFGIVLPQGITRLRNQLPEILEDGDNGLPGLMRALLSTLLTHLKDLDQQIVALEREIVAWHRRNENSRRLERVPGIGPITASALVASIGNASNFKNGRQLAAWLGLYRPRVSSGGKTKLKGISKHGDCIRTLLIHGARAVLRHLERRPAATNSWLARLVARRNRNVAAVALANKNARIAWALLAHQRDFVSDYVSTAPAH